MKVLLCHNYYRQRGGEDESFEAEAELLEAQRHHVIRYTRHNRDIAGAAYLSIAGKTIWNRQSHHDLSGLIRRERPDVMHCNNLFPLISPAAYRAARDHRVPIVQALRNYRTFCLNGLFLRNNKICMQCDGGLGSWRGVMRGCYRGNRAGSAVVASLQLAQQITRAHHESVDLFFTPSAFARQLYIDRGFDTGRIRVKPNFNEWIDFHENRQRDDYALFVGRLSSEKGVEVMLRAWLATDRLPELRVVGGGPMMADVTRAAARGRVTALGQLPRKQTLDLIAKAAFVIVPSIWHEVFGRVVTEAYACGTPVVAARIGALPEIVKDGQTGVLCEPENASDLAAKAQALAADPVRCRAMGRAGRAWYEQAFSPQANYDMLIAIYKEAIRRHEANE